MAKHPPLALNVFAKRLKEARELRDLPQDKLGVLIGLDEGCSSTRISRYESGIHQPPLATAQLLASKLGVPLPYLYCDDELLAKAILLLSELNGRKLAEEIKRLELLVLSA